MHVLQAELLKKWFSMGFYPINSCHQSNSAQNKKTACFGLVWSSIGQLEHKCCWASGNELCLPYP